ncbi:AI-2E family transporter [Halomicrobium sp. LC1Hm]|uniref:AI-2E family transporter n=1 Tax=Halomicrobium sp. LC1Hm TaxID=2610902 RepID=UPI0012983590|nr:AI-2E family transporter [Halomicrobium sp. LC1Hm]QGA82661.1 putative PurR-regulated permease PerM [Halomicrobium sp. LC1Hm]
MVEFEFDVDWPRTAWVALGFVLAAALVFVAYRFVGTFVFGLFVYYATRRLYRRVRRRIDQASVAAGVSLVGMVLPALLLLAYTLGIALQQLNRFADEIDGAESGSQIDDLLETAEPYLNLTVLSDPTALLDNVGGVGTITTTLESALGYLGVVGTGLLHLFVMLAIAFYLLRDDRRFAGWAGHLTAERTVFEEFVAAVDESFDKVFYGNILNAMITGLVGGIVYTLLNQIAPASVAIPYAALVGVLAGAASLIPIVGMKLVYVPMAAYLAVLAGTSGEGWWFVVAFAAVSFVVVDVIPDLLVRPYVSGGELHTGALMFAYILGPLIWGWYGIFLGPIVLVLVTHFARIVLPELVTDEPIRAREVDPAVLTDDTDGADAVDGEKDADGGTPTGA